MPTKGFILPAFSERKQLESLKEEFVRAADKYPGLGYGWMSLTLPETPQGDSYLEAEVRVLKFNTVYPRLVAKAAAGNRKVVELVPSFPTAVDTLEMDSVFGLAYAKAFREEFGFAEITHRFFMEDSPGDGAAFRLFRQLAESADRCREGEGDSPDSLRGWMNTILWLSDAGHDPILRMYRISLELGPDQETFYAGAMPFASVPEEQAVSIDGEQRPWIDLLRDLMHCDFSISLLECGLFRASAYAIDKLLDEDLDLMNPARIQARDAGDRTAWKPPRNYICAKTIQG